MYFHEVFRFLLEMSVPVFVSLHLFVLCNICVASCHHTCETCGFPVVQIFVSVHVSC